MEGRREILFFWKATDNNSIRNQESNDRTRLVDAVIFTSCSSNCTWDMEDAYIHVEEQGKEGASEG